MKQSGFVVGMLTLLGACATAPEPRTIIVDGSAKVRIEPEIFRVSASFRTRNPDQAAGLAELSQKLAQIRQSIPRLEGIKAVEINASSIELTGVPDPDCLRAAQYNADKSCAVIGRFGSVDVTITGSPPNRAGATVSLLSEMGAETVELRSYELADSAAAQNKALAAAVADARAKADAIAASSGSRVTGLMKLQYGRGFGNENGMASAFSLQVTLPEEQQATTTTRPAIDLNVEPPPVDVEATVTAAFAIQ